MIHCILGETRVGVVCLGSVSPLDIGDLEDLMFEPIQV